MIFERSQTVSVAEADLICRIFRHGRPMHLSSHDLRRARRLLALGLLVQGRLGDRYFGTSATGAAFVANRKAEAAG